jgi:hypothetical protein
MLDEAILEELKLSGAGTARTSRIVYHAVSMER